MPRRFFLRWERTLITRDLAWSAFAFAAALCVHSAAVLLLPGLFILAVGKIELIRPCRRRTLAYEAYVENALDDRIVVTAWYDVYANRYPGWMTKRPVIVITQGVRYLAGLRLVPQDAGESAIYRVLR